MNPTERLQELFLKFPGIGPKQSAKFVYFLLRAKAEYKIELAKNIEYLKNTSSVCEKCLRVFSKQNSLNSITICEICINKHRDASQLMIITKDFDMDAIEKTNLYNGRYFILGNILPFLTEKPSEVIHIRELVKLLSENLTKEDTEELETDNKIQEIIFAMPASDEGDNTIDYIKKTLAQIVGIEKIKMSKLARGLSTGLDIEYVDKNTFKEAFTHRE